MRVACESLLVSGLHTELLAVVAGVALMTAACGGGSSSPHVAATGKSSGDGTGSSAATGSPDAGTACIQYLAAAQNALRGGQPFPASPSPAGLAQFSLCMRANGVSNHPSGAGSPPVVNSRSPARQKAATACGGGELVAGAIEVGGGPAGNGVDMVAFGPVSSLQG